MKNDEDVMEELKEMTEGLLFMSESDYPFEIVCWKGLTEITPQYLRGREGQAEDAPVERVSVDEFFRVAISEDNGRAEESRSAAKRYRELAELMREQLEELRVYRVGEINITVYIVGRAQTGHWLGVSTHVVET
jgi:hypothetical protein